MINDIVYGLKDQTPNVFFRCENLMIIDMTNGFEGHTPNIFLLQLWGIPIEGCVKKTKE